jgi:hypothetical protein
MTVKRCKLAPRQLTEFFKAKDRRHLDAARQLADELARLVERQG